jgi:hypothetical protein
MEALRMKESNIKLANQLSIEDMSELIQIFADRICVFNIKHKSSDNITRSEDWQPVYINGAVIEIAVDG